MKRIPAWTALLVLLLCPPAASAACGPDDPAVPCPLLAPAAGPVGETTEQTRGEAAREISGETASQTASEISGETASQTAGETTGEGATGITSEAGDNRGGNTVSNGAGDLTGEAARLLARCLPAIAREAADPVAEAHRRGSGWLPAGASDGDRLPLGRCLAREGLPPADDAAAGPEAVARQVEDLLLATLQGKQCTGSGPDDCVLISLLLAELAPASSRVAAALQAIDPRVQVDERLAAAPPPPAAEGDFQHPWDDYLKSLLRRSAFLRAKLASQLHGPAAWPADAWLETDREVAAIESRREKFRYFEDTLSHYGRDFLPEVFSPTWALDQWLVAPTPAATEMRRRLIDQARVSAAAADCRPPGSDGYAYAGLTPLAALEFAAARLAAGDETDCPDILPAWDAPRRGPGQYADPLASEYAAAAARITALIGRPGQGIAHEEALGWYLAAQGETCAGLLFDPWEPGRKGRPCSPWISEAQAVKRALPNSRLTLTKAETFAVSELPLGPDAKLVDAVAPLVPEAGEALAAILDAIENHLGRPHSAQLFHHPRHAKRLLVLGVDGAAPATQPRPRYLTGDSGRVALVIDGGKVQPLWIPPRFAYQDGDGTIAAVSDLDRDGNLEIWFQGTWGECDPDAVPGPGCAMAVLTMGEEFGNALSWFVRGPQPANGKSEAVVQARQRRD